MASIISAGTTSGTALNMSGDTSGALQLATNGTTTAVTIDTSQNVGIGITTVPSDAKVAISGTGLVLQDAAGAILRFNKTAGTDTGWLSNRSYGWHNGNGLALSTQTADDLKFGTNSTERMRIDSSGNLLVGTTSSTGKFTVSSNASAGRVAAVLSNTASDAGSAPLLVSKFDNVNSTSQVFVAFAIANNTVGNGQINGNGASSAAFGSYSDSRLKENIVDLPSQLANIMALRPVEFDYIESAGGGHQIGFVAQEVKEIYPDLVGESSDGMLTLTDMNKNDARLIKAIQELKSINDTQAETINALTARIVALEQA